jgi:hypothetical protein
MRIIMKKEDAVSTRLLPENCTSALPLRLGGLGTKRESYMQKFSQNTTTVTGN